MLQGVTPTCLVNKPNMYVHMYICMYIHTYIGATTHIVLIIYICMYLAILT